MKKLITLLMLALPLAVLGQASLENDPAYLPIDKMVDFKATPPQVNVNLPRFLLKDALAGLVNSNTPGNPTAELADMLKDVKLIRVVVIQANETNRSALEKAAKALRGELDAKWMPIVNVPEQNVGVYAKSDPSGESMAGVAVLVFNGDNFVIANVVGNVSIGRLIKMATQAKKLPPGLMNMLQGVGSPGSMQPPQPVNQNNGRMESDTPTNPPAAEPPQVSGTK